MTKFATMTAVTALALGVSACSKTENTTTTVDNVAVNDVTPIADNVVDNAVVLDNAATTNLTDANATNVADANSSGNAN